MQRFDTDIRRFELALRQRVHRKHLCILVIDSQTLSQHMAMEMLSREHEVVACTSYLQALNAYQIHAPDIVFLDIDNPGMNGLDILDHIAMLDPEAYVVLLTAGEQRGEHLYRCVHGNMIRPFTRHKLVQHLSRFGQVYPNRGTKLA